VWHELLQMPTFSETSRTVLSEVILGQLVLFELWNWCHMLPMDGIVKCKGPV
jgi:hypothetical protein